MKKIAVGIAILVPGIAAADNLQGINGIINGFGSIVGSLIPIAFGIALVAFFWGVAKYIFAAGEESSLEEGRRIMIGGVIAIFVIASIWGLVTFIQTELGITGSGTNPSAPTITGLGNPGF